MSRVQKQQKQRRSKQKRDTTTTISTAKPALTKHFTKSSPSPSPEPPVVPSPTNANSSLSFQKGEGGKLVISKPIANQQQQQQQQQQQHPPHHHTPPPIPTPAETPPEPEGNLSPSSFSSSSSSTPTKLPTEGVSQEARTLPNLTEKVVLEEEIMVAMHPLRGVDSTVCLPLARHADIMILDEMVRPSAEQEASIPEITRAVDSIVNVVFKDRSMISCKIPYNFETIATDSDDVGISIDKTTQEVTSVASGLFWEKAGFKVGMKILSVTINDMPVTTQVAFHRVFLKNGADMQVEVLSSSQEEDGALCVYLLGSWLRGTALSTSALDICVPLSASQEMISRLSTLISVQQGSCLKLSTSPPGHPSSLCLVHSASGLICYVHFTTKHSAGIWQGSVAEYPENTPFIRVLKTMTRNWGLRVPSLALEVMVTAVSATVTQCDMGVVSQLWKHEAGLGGRLAGFLYWYGVVLDWGLSEVSLGAGTAGLSVAFRPKEQKRQHTPFVVVDPVTGANLAEHVDFGYFVLLLGRSSAVYSSRERTLLHILRGVPV